jgi:hypothetical protein
MVSSGGHSLRDLLDYEHGVTPDEFFKLHAHCLQLQAERKKDSVENFTVALGSIFDTKMLKKFNQAMEKVIRELKNLRIVEEEPIDKKEKKRIRQEKTRRSQNQLKKLLSLDKFTVG